MKASILSKALQKRIASAGRGRVVLVKRKGKSGWSSAFVSPKRVDVISRKLKAGYIIVEGGRVYPSNPTRTKRNMKVMEEK